MSAHFGTIDLGPPRKTGDDWYFTPRPAESLDAAEVSLVTKSDAGPAAGEDQPDDAAPTEQR